MIRSSYWFIALCLFALPHASYAQFGNESPIPYFRYSATAGFGPALLYGDLDRRQIGGGVYLKGNYFVAHGISVGLELQQGLLRGADSAAISGTAADAVRKANNLYHAAIFGVTFQPFKYFQDDHMRRIEYRESFGKRVLNSAYVGAGMGVLYNLQWDKRRAYGPVESTDGQGNIVIVERALAEHAGSNYGFSYLVSTNIGVELPLHRLKPDLLDSYIWNLVINGQLNFSLDDELDGYSGTYAGNEHKDAYGLFTIGINLRF